MDCQRRIIKKIALTQTIPESFDKTFTIACEGVIFEE